jgi:hypothetical protein
MSPRRKRRPLLREGLALWAAILAVVLALALWHVFGWLLATAAIAGTAYALGRRSSRSRAPAVPRGRRPAPVETARTRANGWTPPGRSMLLSAECAQGEHVWCHDGRCQCDCGHPSQRPAHTAPTPAEPPF